MLGITERELAAQVCQTPRTIDRWEKGETVPTIEQTELLADALRIPLRFLYTPPLKSITRTSMGTFEPFKAER